VTECPLCDSQAGVLVCHAGFSVLNLLGVPTGLVIIEMICECLWLVLLYFALVEIVLSYGVNGLARVARNHLVDRPACV
jgi:hypothetical protein